MKLKRLIPVLTVIIFSILITLTGCDGKSNEAKPVNKEEQRKPEKVTIENGIYGYVAEEGEEGLADGDITVELNEDGTIMLYDSFAYLAQEGTYEIVGNKIVGTYTRAYYMDHTDGGDATKDIDEKFEFEIIDKETIKDLIGYGSSFDHVMMKDALYRYNNVPENMF